MEFFRSLSVSCIGDFMCVGLHLIIGNKQKTIVESEIITWNKFICFRFHIYIITNFQTNILFLVIYIMGRGISDPIYRHASRRMEGPNCLAPGLDLHRNQI